MLQIPEVIPAGIPLIDTIRVSGQITAHSLPWESVSRGHGSDGVYSERFTSGRVDLPHCRLLVRHLYGNYEAVIEQSLPTLQYGHNADPVDVLTAQHLIGLLHEEAADHVEWAVPAEQLRVSRLDVDRDFTGVDDLDPLLRGLGDLHVARSGNAHVWFDSTSRGGALTMSRKVGGSRGQLYDKHTQLADLSRQAIRRDASRRQQERAYFPLYDLTAAQRKHLLETEAERARGVLRFEANLRSNLLTRNGIKVVSDLDEGVLARVGEDMFRRLRLGTPVGGRALVDSLRISLAASHDPDFRFLDQVVGRLDAERLGTRPCRTSSDAKSRERKLAAKWGISAADTARSTGPARHLDWDTATLQLVPDSQAG